MLYNQKYNTIKIKSPKYKKAVPVQYIYGDVAYFNNQNSSILKRKPPKDAPSRVIVNKIITMDWHLSRLLIGIPNYTLDCGGST